MGSMEPDVIILSDDDESSKTTSSRTLQRPSTSNSNQLFIGRQIVSSQQLPTITFNKVNNSPKKNQHIGPLTSHPSYGKPSNTTVMNTSNVVPGSSLNPSGPSTKLSNLSESSKPSNLNATNLQIPMRQSPTMPKNTATASILNERPLDMRTILPRTFPDNIHPATSLQPQPPIPRMPMTQNSNQKGPSATTPNITPVTRVQQNFQVAPNRMLLSQNGIMPCTSNSGFNAQIEKVRSNGHLPSDNNSGFHASVKRPRLDSPLMQQINSYHLGKLPFTEAQVREKMLAHERLKEYISKSFAEAIDKKAGLPVLDDDCFGQFLCTYKGCGKRLRNNVVFMYHLWAHLINARTSAEKIYLLGTLPNPATNPKNVTVTEDWKSDISWLKTCPECLTVQPNPYRKQLHYHRVHKRDGYFESRNLTCCTLCETVILCERLQEHIEAHIHNSGNGEFELPYSCKKCKYKTTFREAFITHFVRKHGGSNTVLCPFCFLIFKITANDRRRLTITLPQYVEHILSHNTDNFHSCHYCAAKIPTPSAAYHWNLNSNDTTVIQQHYQQHNQNNTSQKIKSWSRKTRNLSALKQCQTVVNSMDEHQKICLECSKVIVRGFNRDPSKTSSSEQHFTRFLMGCKKCNYRTHCQYSMKMHEFLSLCNPKNAVRWPFGFTTTLPHYKVECGKCGFVDKHNSDLSSVYSTPSSNQPKIWQHMKRSLCRGNKVKLHELKELPECSNITDEEELHEIEVFGLKRLSNVDVKQKRDTENMSGGGDVEEASRVISERNKLVKELNSMLLQTRSVEFVSSHPYQAILSHLLYLNIGESEDEVRKTGENLRYWLNPHHNIKG